jgi:hypothetical protein
MLPIWLRGLLPIGVLEELPACLFQQWHIFFYDRPDESIIDRRVLMGELIAEIDDPAGVRDRPENRWRGAEKGCSGLDCCAGLTTSAR